MEGLQLLIPTFGISLAEQYAAAVLATGPIAYWKLDEGSGATAVDSSGNSYDGSYTGITWDGTQAPQGTQAPFFDGTNDYGDVYSAGFASAFNLDEFTIMLWLKVNSAAVWTDGVRRDPIMLLRDGGNFVNVRKATTANTLQFFRNGAGTLKSTSASASDTGFTNIAVSCSIAGGGLLTAGDLRAYKDGVQVGTTQTGNIASTGSGLASPSTVLGAANTTPTNVWHGYIAHAAVWDRPIDNDILALATV